MSSIRPKAMHLVFSLPTGRVSLGKQKSIACDTRSTTLSQVSPGDLTDSVTKALLAVQISWDQAGKEYEAGTSFMSSKHVSHDIPNIWPYHQVDIATLVLYPGIYHGGLIAWRSDAEEVDLASTIYTLVLHQISHFKDAQRGLKALLQRCSKFQSSCVMGFDSNVRVPS